LLSIITNTTNLGFPSSHLKVAFLPLTAGAVAVQMEYKAVENMDSTD